MKRGDLVTVSLEGDNGKPRPALVVQSDLFADARSRTVLPLTSALVDAPLIRITVTPNARNSLQRPSQVMVDKPATVPVDKLGSAFGVLDDTTMVAVDRSMALFLGMG